MFRASVLASVIWLCGAMLAWAQQPAPAAPQPEPAGSPCMFGETNKSWRSELVETGHWVFEGQVEFDCQNGQFRIFADKVEWFTDANRIVASGNVVFINPEGRIAAEQVDFDLGAGTGTFHEASGLMSLGKNADRKQWGNQEPDIYFWGEVIDKIGARRYKITHGGFTTCVQPTPRWELVNTSVVINLNDYAIARNTVLRVKGVPLFYVPILYYPIQEDERATGFLLPTYGTSTFRGQTISNGFFWAINRSQDATIYHDWFTRAGQGAGAEYRYVAGQQSQGNFRVYRFSRRETQFTNDGTVTVLPANTSFDLTGTATQVLTSRIRARVRLDYFSDVSSQQLLHQNLYEASRRSRSLEGVLNGTFGKVGTSLLYQRNEVLNSATDTVLYGSTPRFTASVAPQQLFGAPIYGSVNTESAFLPYRRTNGETVTTNGFGRIDLMPTIRMPLSRLTFLSVNTSASYRSTYYSRSADPLHPNDPTLAPSYLRNYMMVSTDVVGPVLTRIWDRPETSFAERMKHVIEPSVSVDVTSPITDYRRTPVLSDISDFVVGGSMLVTYGLTNRLFYRGRSENGTRGQTREFVTVGLQQTYYTNPESSRYDTSYQSANSNDQRDLSPIALNVRVSPSNAFDADARMEYDVSGGGLTSLSTGTSLNMEVGSASLNYSRRHYSSSSAENYLRASTRLQLFQRQTTGNYSVSWDISKGYIVNQTMMLSYMAQCCGFQVEFQKYNYASSSNLPIPADRRFNFGFVLAGLGTFSNFFGAFGGQ